MNQNMRMHVKILRGILILSFAVLIVACDRIEGKAKDFASSSATTITSVVRNVTVSDLQKNAETICINAFTKGIIKPEPTPYYEYASPAHFQMGQYYSVEVKVVGDGRYSISVPVFREDGITGLFTGQCNVENGIVVEAKLYAPR